MKRLGLRLSTALGALALLGSPGTVASAQNGVTFDSGPAGKEYAIPLDQARRQASGTSSGTPDTPGVAATTPTGSGGTSSSAPLFGEGIGDGSTGKQAVSDVGAAAGRHGRAEQRNGSSRQAATVDAALTATKTSAGGGGGITIMAMALALLVLGGVIGSISRRRWSA